MIEEGEGEGSEMAPLICIVGKSNTGKTTLLEKLIPEITRRGYRVGTIKHDAHGFEMDRPGKDTWRHAQAGAWAVAISSPAKVAMIQKVDKEKTIEELAAMMEDTVDIIFAEGYKRSSQLKVEISRSEVSTELLCSEEELVAIVSDVSHAPKVPQFGLDDMKGLADLLEEAYLKHPRRPYVSLEVDGKEIPLKDFIQDIFDRAMRGMVSSLHNTEGANNIVLRLSRPADDSESK
jgi:molybdopterin-guanine dinucleotide biosynthesis protein B